MPRYPINEYVCPECKNTNSEHKSGCSRQIPEAWGPEDHQPADLSRLGDDGYNELLASHERLKTALEALWTEVRWSGNDKATNDGWPNVMKLTREALAQIPKGE